MQYNLGGKQHRESTGCWTWKKAEEAAKHRIAMLTGGSAKREEMLTVYTAAERYMAFRTREKRSNDKHSIMTRKLLEFCNARRVYLVREITTPLLSDFKGTLPYASHLKNSGSLRIHWSMIGAFFSWLMGEGLIEKNPFPKGPQHRTEAGKPEVRPFSDREVDVIVQAAGSMEGWSTERRAKARTLTLVMRWSGMAISDAVMLPHDRLKGNRVITNRKKTGEFVYVPLPGFVVEALEALPCDDPEFFFWHRGKNGKKLLQTTIVHHYEAEFRLVFAAAGVKGHPHMFRHTFITKMLAAGERIEDVADMAGNSPVEIRKTYKHWISDMHKRLDEAASRAWQKMGLDEQGNPLKTRVN
jgi:integrase